MHQNFCLKKGGKKRPQNMKILTLELDQCLIKVTGRQEKFEKSITERTKLKRQQPHLLDTPKQKRFNDFLSQIKEEQKKYGSNFVGKSF